MEKEIIAVIKWQYFLRNHGCMKDILYKIYPKWLADHFYRKYVRFSEKHTSAYMGISELFIEMDGESQVKLINWVMKHYHGMDKLFYRYEEYINNLNK